MSIGKQKVRSLYLVILKILNFVVIITMFFVGAGAGVIPVLFCDAGPVTHCLTMGGVIGGSGVAISLLVGVPLFLSLYRPRRYARIVLVLYSGGLIAGGLLVCLAQGHVGWPAGVALLGIANLLGIALLGLGRPR